MKIIKPNKLKKGDLIGIISPASSLEDLALIESGIRYIEGFGYSTTIGKSVGKVRGYLAGTDEERVADLHQMFSDKIVKAIFCLRGGYGAVRLLDKIDFKLIRNNPKIFVGFSEITALHMAFFKKTGLVTFAGPMVVPNFSGKISSFTEENFWGTISSLKKRISVEANFLFGMNTKNPSGVSGRILGGNLAVLTSIVGSKYFPDLKESILFLEEVSEPPYKIDRMLNHLKLNNVFKKVKGIVLGSFIDCTEKDITKKTLTLEQIFEDYFSKLNIPVFSSFPHGHINDLISFPFGVKVKLNLISEKIEFLEEGVRYKPPHPKSLES